MIYETAATAERSI